MLSARVFVCLLSSFILGSGLLQAAPVISIDSGSLTASRIISGSTGESLFDVRGATILSVSDPGLLGFAVLLDEASGGDPDFSVIPFDNSLILGSNIGFTEIVSIQFDLTPIDLTATTARFQALVSPFVPPTITDPALTALGTLLYFDFSLISLVGPGSDGNFFATYVLSGVSTPGDTEIPEPQFLAGAGLALAYLKYRKIQQHRKNQLPN